MFKGFAVGIDYDEKPYSIDPYSYGLWLRDGTSEAASITTPHHSIFSTLLVVDLP